MGTRKKIQFLSIVCALVAAMSGRATTSTPGDVPPVSPKPLHTPGVNTAPPGSPDALKATSGEASDPEREQGKLYYQAILESVRVLSNDLATELKNLERMDPRGLERLKKALGDNPTTETGKTLKALMDIRDKSPEDIKKAIEGLKKDDKDYEQKRYVLDKELDRRYAEKLGHGKGDPRLLEAFNKVNDLQKKQELISTLEEIQKTNPNFGKDLIADRKALAQKAIADNNKSINENYRAFFGKLDLETDGSTNVLKAAREQYEGNLKNTTGFQRYLDEAGESKVGFRAAGKTVFSANADYEKLQKDFVAAPDQKTKDEIAVKIKQAGLAVLDGSERYQFEGLNDRKAFAFSKTETETMKFKTPDMLKSTYGERMEGTRYTGFVWERNSQGVATLNQYQSINFGTEANLLKAKASDGKPITFAPFYHGPTGTWSLMITKEGNVSQSPLNLLNQKPPTEEIKQAVIFPINHRNTSWLQVQGPTGYYDLTINGRDLKFKQSVPLDSNACSAFG